MKKFYLILVFLVYQIGQAQSQSYELGSNKDTINLIDAVGKKQGKWILRGKHKPGSCYQPEQKAEEGKYQDNRKIGKWIEYYCNGNMKNQLTFQNGRPDGYAIMYHENGKISEEGNWKNNRWVGNYKLYYENGQVQHEFVFNPNGKREGPQKYFYENGQVAIEGNFVNGKEAGVIKEYHENGDLKAEKTFNDGAVDVASIKEYEPKKPIVKIKDAPVDNAPKIIVTKDEKPNEAVSASKGPMILNGQHTLYNKNKQITKDGVFKDNRLMEGKAYIYDENGILQRISVYKGGAYVGDAPIEN
ncbi:MAG: toxin-antitoxin system YwqK family antitoxin [Bacteroidetes bacterium]|nr:toxin-antitoxin system YwqK family antitoxin [Bacteroidota bacterium]